MLFTFITVLRSAGLAIIVVYALIQTAIQPLVVGRPATIVFAPWVSGGEAIARATVGARLLARGGAPFAVTVVPESTDYAAIIAGSGAWLATGLVRQVGCNYRDRVAEPARP